MNSCSPCNSNRGCSSSRKVCLDFCGEWNNWEPTSIDSMLVTTDISYGIAVNREQALFVADGPCYGITAYKGHDEAPEWQPRHGYEAGDMAAILTYGLIACQLFGGQSTAGQNVYVTEEGFILGNVSGNPDTFMLTNAIFETNSFQGDIAQIRLMRPAT